MLKENTIFGIEDKVAIVLERIKHFEPKDGYWVGISGGKDSTVIYDLVHKAGVKAEYHHSLTTIDAPQTIHYMREHQPDVVITRPKMPLLQRMIEKGTPPQRQIRWCCGEYKERGGEGRLVITGVRWSESSRRSKRGMMEHCLKGKEKRFLHPILDWSDTEVWEYINTNKLPVNPLYSMGYKRVGCVLCPMTRNTVKQVADFPKIAEAWRKAFIRMFASRVERGLECKQISGDAWFKWWLNRDAKNPDTDDDRTIFEDDGSVE